MRCCSTVLLLVFGWGFCSPEGQADTTPAGSGSDRVTALITQLGNDRFTERAAASQALDALGPVALDALRQAAGSDDVEIRRRALELVEAIDKRVESTQLLAPRRVRLVFKDRPVTEAVKEFAEKTAFPVQIDKATTGLAVAGRRITLDTGDATFWEAYDQFCRQAGLVEELPRPVNQPVMNPYNVPNGAFVWNGGGYSPPAVTKPVSLVAGKAAALPTCNAGAVRIRALPPQTQVAGEAKGEGETLFALEVVSDPALQWRGIVGMRVTNALDEKGIRLHQPDLFVGTSLASPEAMSGMVMLSDYPAAMPVARDPRQVPVRLRLGKSESRMLQELSGTISARVQSPPQPLLTVDDVLTAGGRTVKGRHGGIVKVLSVQRQANKRINLHVHVEGPASDFIGLGAPGVVFVGGGLGMVQDPNGAGLNASQLSLLDAKGQAYRLAKVNSQNAVPNELILTYEPQGDQGEAAQLVFTGTRVVTVEIPFTLKDVPLP